MAEAERIIGTPEVGDDTQPEPVQPKGRRRITALLVVALLAYLLDLGSKMLVVAKLEHQAPIRIVGDLLKFEAIRNPGAAFGFGEAFTIIFTIIAATVIVVIVRLARKLYSLPWAIALGLLLGGALGNLTDRMFREPGFPVGHVIDFINTPWMMPAIYNIADIFIVSMMIGVALLVLVGLHLDGTREARRTTATGSGESAGGAAGDGEADAAASDSSKD